MILYYQFYICTGVFCIDLNEFDKRKEKKQFDYDKMIMYWLIQNNVCGDGLEYEYYTINNYVIVCFIIIIIICFTVLMTNV